MQPTFTFTAELWLHDGGKWIFITVPLDESEEIREIAPNPGGFGSVRVEVRIGDSTWRTSVFPDSKSGCFVLPIKKPIRAAEKIDLGDIAEVDLTIVLD